jgi:nicotinamide mononucleotide (NMN) deamidase PncC
MVHCEGKKRSGSYVTRRIAGKASSRAIRDEAIAVTGVAQPGKKQSPV